MEISGNSYIPSSYSAAEKKNLPVDAAVNAELIGTGKNTSAPYVQSAEDAKAAAKAKNDQTIADFNDYMSMSTMEKFTESWLRRHGMSKEEFEKLGAEEKRKSSQRSKRILFVLQSWR